MMIKYKNVYLIVIGKRIIFTIKRKSLKNLNKFIFFNKKNKENVQESLSYS